MELHVEDLTVVAAAPGGQPLTILDLPRFDADGDAQIAIVGGSGTGKTTLLHCLAGIVQPATGSIVFRGVEGGDADLAAMREVARDRFRARHIGYVFQTFNLLQGLTALENVAVAAHFGGQERAAADAASRRLLERVGLAGRLGAYPATLSVGEQQRVAIARALVNRPVLILADEPTASLDERNGEEVLQLLAETAREAGSMLILVTHERAVWERFPRVVQMAEVCR